MIDWSGILGFDWDDGNSRKNESHGVSQSEAEEVFFNDPLLLQDRAHSAREPRFHALGQTHEGRRLHITFTLRATGTRLRVISARDMHRKERMIHDRSH